MKILLGWELGGGQAHVHRLAAIARLVESYNAEPIFALKSYEIKGIYFPWKIIPSPPLAFLGRAKSYTFTDILETFGFGKIESLKSQLQAWHSILKDLDPKLIIADYAPSLVLAALGKIQTIVIGGGFTVPPSIDDFPILEFPAPPESFQRREQVKSTINKITRSNISIGEALNGDYSFIFSIPELDPYQYLRAKEKYVGIHIAPLPPALYCSDGPVWTYLADDYSNRQALLNSFQLQESFRPLKESLAGKSLAIHHGSLTTSIACILAGIPQFLIPRHSEERLNSLALQKLGVARILEKTTWEDLVLARAQSHKLAEVARNQASSFSHWNQSYMGTIDIILRDLTM